MRRDSIYFSITLFFGMALISVITLFYLLIQVEYDTFRAQTFKRYGIADRILSVGVKHREPIELITEQIRSINFRIVLDFSEIQDIIEVTKHLTPVSEITVLKSKHRAFIKIENPEGIFILEDLDSRKKLPMRLYFSLFASLLILVIVYLIVVRKLAPLSALRLKIRKFGEGQMDISTATDKKDEIADVANEFDSTIQKINNLNASRKLFLRNIMHELKTPLTKGRIAAEMLEESKNKERLVDVFARMDSLIEQLGKIEQLISGYLEIKRREFRFIDVFEHVQDLLMIDKTCIDINRADLKLLADFELFSIAVKNLIDNGLKYSQDKKVSIDIRKNDIYFISKGPCLKEELEFYTKPFSRDNTNNKQGMGLGLYITSEILAKHGFTLRYECKEEGNCFIITIPEAV
jgi:two-component system OmpR family sensor kinase